MSYYASELTREYLESLGITGVSPDGKYIYKGDKELHQYKSKNDGYLRVLLYDPKRRQEIPVELRNNSTGQLSCGVHRIVYTWFNGKSEAGMVIDHINNDKADNRIENLRQITARENVMKCRKESTRELQCSLKKPRAFYEHKLKNFELDYEAAKEEGEPKRCHLLRTQIAHYKARLRYWDSHADQASQIAMNLEALEMEHDMKQKRVANMKAFREIATAAKKLGNYRAWHDYLGIIKSYDAFTAEQIDEIIKKAKVKYNVV